jgi:hypothetical protein
VSEPAGITISASRRTGEALHALLHLAEVADDAGAQEDEDHDLGERHREHREPDVQRERQEEHDQGVLQRFEVGAIHDLVLESLVQPLGLAFENGRDERLARHRFQRFHGLERVGEPREQQAVAPSLAPSGLP